MVCRSAIQTEILRTTKRFLFLLLLVNTAGCTTESVRMNSVPPPDTLATRTIQVYASSSISGSPIGDDPPLRQRVATAFQRQLPGARLVQSKPDMVVFFTI